MFRITRNVILKAVICSLCSATYLHAAETNAPTPEEFRGIVRQLNESGGNKLEGTRLRPAPVQPPKAVEHFNRALSLHTKKDASVSELKEAASLYQAASDAGLSQASNNLALLYLEGKGVKKDVKKAVSLLNASSKKNDPQADVVLAKLYLSGKEVKLDEKKGEWHLSRAAKSGNQNAVKMLSDYKEWKKKNELAMKQFQELLKKSQSSQIKPNVQSLPQLSAMNGSKSAALPAITILGEKKIPVIPGDSYLGASKQFTLTPPSPRIFPSLGSISQVDDRKGK